MDTQERFRELCQRFATTPGITQPGTSGASGARGFGAAALKLDGSIVAMLMRGQLVVKLPQARVEDLIAAGTGAPFDSGKGRPMREWVTVTREDDDTWLALAREAVDFAAARGRR